MADFRKWKIDFDGNDSALVERRHVPDPPGYDSSTGRELVRLYQNTKGFKGEGMVSLLGSRAKYFLLHTG